MSRNQALLHYHFDCVDENDNLITSGLKVAIYAPSVGTALTVYADQAETALTNPITSTVFDAAPAGKIDFWYAGQTVDVVINDGIGRMISVMSLTPSQNRIIFDSRLAITGVMGNLTGTDLVDTEGTFTAYAETVTLDGTMLRPGDLIHIVGQVIADDIHAASAELAIQILFGTEVILQTGDVTFAADDDAIAFDCWVKVLTTGASGTIMFWGNADKQLSGVVSAAPCASPTGICGVLGNTEDISGDVSISVKGDYESAHADQESQVFLNVIVHKGMGV